MLDSLLPYRLHHARLPCLSYLEEFSQIHINESMMLSNQLILCHSLLFLPLIFLCNTVFSNRSTLCIRWPKYYSFSISPSNEYSGFISFRINWFDLLAGQGTLKSLPKNHNTKASVLPSSAFVIVQFSHLFTTNGKNHSFECMKHCWQK